MRWILRRLSYANIAATLALFLALGGTAYAANGGSFLLGRSNAASLTTTLTNTGAAPALTLRPRTGFAPLSTTSRVKAPNLNADLLDGVDSTQLALASGSTGFIVGDDPNGDASATCPEGTRLTGGGGVAAGPDNFLFLTAPDPTTTRTWLASAAPAGEEVLAIAICYNPRGTVPGAMPLSAVRSLQQRARLAHGSAH
jgi:hypothetical protein